MISHLNLPKFFPVLIFFLFLLIPVSTEAQPVKLYGQAPAYSGHHLVFYRYQNFINFQKEALFTMEVDDTGRFAITADLAHTTYVFTDMGQYRAFIYLEPGKQYQLVLPPYGNLAAAQKLNPFFEPELIPLGIANAAAGELNRLIYDFDEAFAYQFDKYAPELFSTQNRTLALTIIDTLENRFPVGHPFFIRHKTYHYARLLRLAQRRQERQIISEYFSGQPVDFYLPAYWEAFREIFSGFPIPDITGHQEGFASGAKADSSSFRGLEQALASDTLFTRTDLREAVLIWSLLESFYKKTDSETIILALMEQASREAYSPEIKEVAAVLFHKMTLLRPGTPAPDFELKDLNGMVRTLGEYKGKFVYLNFMHSQDFASQKALNTLSPLARDLKRELEVVTILLDEDEQAAREYINSTLQPGWDILIIDDRSLILEEYDVHAVPAYFLIDPEGKIVLSPSPAPLENFREVFAEQYLKYHRKKQREERPNQRSIFDF